MRLPLSFVRRCGIGRGINFLALVFGHATDVVKECY